VLQQHIALGVGDQFGRIDRFLQIPDEIFFVGGDLGLGPSSTLDAATRSSFNADNARPSTASTIIVSGMPYQGEMQVHLPVPFCSAVSKILSTIGSPSSSL